MSLKNKNKSRTYNLIANSSIGIIASIIQVLINYVVRIVIVRDLGAEINGLNSLFESIINIMMLMEAGFSTAMVIHLYKPIEDKNQDEIKGIMNFYKRIYFYIGTGILILGLFTSYFILDSLVTTTISMSKVRFYFILFTLSFVLYYYTYHKRSILFAEQKNRVSTLVALLCQTIFRVWEIIVIIIYHNYTLFLILMLLEKVTENIMCNHYINKNHCYLKNNKTKIKEETKKSIIYTVKPLLVFNITSTLQRSYKTILISSLLGNISIVGYFGNYQLVIGAVQMLFSQFGAAFTSTFGNLSVYGDKKNMYKVYENFSLFANWISIILCSGFLVCIQDFIVMTFGNDSVLSNICVIILTFEMFIYLINIPIISIQNALGIHDKDKNYMILQTIVSLPLAYLLGKFYGMIGIILGLLIPQIIFTLLYKGFIIFKIVFDKSGYIYIKYILGEMFKFFLVGSICFYITSFINTKFIFVNFILKGVITLILCILLFLIFSFKNELLRQYFIILKDKFLKGNKSIK